MTTTTRRSFIQTAIALGATAAWGQPFGTRSKISWHERRDFYPEGVASGDPGDNSVLLWTVGQGPGDARPQPTMNLLLRHGVRSCREYAKNGDLHKARALSNPGLSPHVSFVDMGGHGYAVVHVTSDSLETEFVCIPRPVQRSERADGGPLLYRTRHRANLWPKVQRPRLEVQVLEGDARFSV